MERNLPQPICSHDFSASCDQPLACQPILTMLGNTGVVLHDDSINGASSFQNRRTMHKDVRYRNIQSERPHERESVHLRPTNSDPIDAQASERGGRCGPRATEVVFLVSSTAVLHRIQKWQVGHYVTVL